MALPAARGPNLHALMQKRLPPNIFKRLSDAGKLARQSGLPAYIVGGLPRDLLLGRKNLDVDIAVEGDGMAFARRFAALHDAGVKTFDRFGTAYVVFPDGFKIDVATLRGESYAHPGALPSVHAGSLHTDLYRRDFTINTLAIRLDGARCGELVDMYGGLHDLKRKAIRVLHQGSFVDDPTRLFRAIRFEQRFGFRLETRTLGFLKKTAAGDLVEKLSGPRLRNELLLLLAERNPPRIVRRLAEFRLLRFIHPAVSSTPALASLLSDIPDALTWWTKRFPDRSPDRSLIYFMSLVTPLPAAAVEKVLKRLAFPNSEAGKIRAVARYLRQAQRASRRPLKPAAICRMLSPLPDEALFFWRPERIAAYWGP